VTDYTTLGRELVNRHVGALEQAVKEHGGPVGPDEALLARLRAIILGAVLEEQARLGQATSIERAEAIAQEAVTCGERGLRCDFNVIAARLLGLDVVSPSADEA
jgi:hypothetical protein